MIEDLYLRQPTPEYRQAFDLAVSQLNRADGPVLAVLSSAAHAVDLLKRCPRPLDLQVPQLSSHPRSRRGCPYYRPRKRSL